MFKPGAGRKVFWVGVVGLALLLAFRPERHDSRDRLQDERATENARLDAEIRHALKTTGTYVPPAGHRPPSPQRDAIWVASVDTLACLSKRSIETLQFLETLGTSGGVRNRASDPSKTDCVHVAVGTPIAVEDWGGETGIATAWVRGYDQRFMVARDLGADGDR